MNIEKHEKHENHLFFVYFVFFDVLFFTELNSDMKKTGLLIVVLLACIAGFAGNVTVSGRANRAQTLVRLMVCDDLMNMHETEIAHCTSDEQGFFILEGNVDQILPARLLVGLEGVDLFVRPNSTYEVTVTIPDVDPSLSYFERPSPKMRIKTSSDQGVYRQIIISEQIINSYVLEYFDQLYRRRQYRYLDSIRETIRAELDIRDDYVKQQNTYKIASIQMAVNADGGKKVIAELFDGKPVLYHCPAYMELFKDLFSNWFYRPAYDIGGFQEAFWNSTEAFRRFMNSDPFMERNPRLAEMILLYNLRTMYREEPRFRKAVKTHLKAIRDKSSYMETKTMVDHTLADFDRFATGASAPDFALPSVSGETVRLSDYKDKMVVLQFVEGSSATVDHQFETLSDLHHQWQDSVQLITITTKDQLEQHKKRFEDHHYDWPLLNLGNDILLLERYEVRTFPEYFIILPGTKIGMAPASEKTLGENVTRLLKE